MGWIRQVGEVGLNYIILLPLSAVFSKRLSLYFAANLWRIVGELDSGTRLCCCRQHPYPAVKQREAGLTPLWRPFWPQWVAEPASRER